MIGTESFSCLVRKADSNGGGPHDVPGGLQ